MPSKSPWKAKFPKLPKFTGMGRKAAVPDNLHAVKQQESQRQILETNWRLWQQSPAGQRSGTNSMLEYICWHWLVDVKKLKPEIDFVYQTPFLGGRKTFGGVVADFYFPSRYLVWDPAGLEFHYTTSANRAKDIMAKIDLAGKGIKYIYLWEDDLMERPIYTLEHAYEGIQLPGRDV